MNGKKFIAPMLAAAFAVTGLLPVLLCETGAKAETVSEGEHFDENNVVLEFGVLSDIHIGYGNNRRLYRNALNYYKTNHADMDGLLITGDLSQSGLESEARDVVAIYEEFYDTSKIPLIECYGNHDTYMYKQNLDVLGWYEAFTAVSDTVYTFDVASLEQIKAGNRWVQLKGKDGKTYDFVCAELNKYGGTYTGMTDETEAWLKETLDTIQRERPNQYVFVAAHSPIPDTVQGSWNLATSAEGSAQMKAVLENYPNVMFFSGHTHSPLMQELSINQSTFTQVHVSSNSDLSVALNNGALTDRHAYSSGEYVELDAEGNVRITRIDFLKNQQIRSPWYLLPCGADGYLDTYNFERRAKANKAPAFPKDAYIGVTERNSTSVYLTFDRAEDDAMVEAYGYSVKDASGNDVSVSVSTVLSRGSYSLYSNGAYSRGYVDDFYDFPDPAYMPAQKTVVLTFPRAIGYPYTVTVVAYDEYGAFSAYGHYDEGVSGPLTLRVTDPSDANEDAAAAFDAGVAAIGGKESLNASSLAKLTEMRAAYATLSVSARKQTRNSSVLNDLESYFYEKIYDFGKTSSYKSDSFDRFLALDEKGSVTDTERGVRLNWKGAPGNSLMGLKYRKDLNGLKIVCSGLKNESADPTLALVITNRRGGKWTDGESLLLEFDLENGALWLQNEVYLGASENFTAAKLGASAFTFAFRTERDGSLVLKLTTVHGEESFTVPARYLQGLSQLSDFANAYVYFTPFSSRQTMQMDVISVAK